MRYQDSSWKKQSGSMKYENGKWNVTGDVLNPVEGFELLNYQGMDWFQGVGSVQDMMAMKTDKSSWVQKLVDNGTISADTFPAWTYYFESLVDDDQLAIDYALGKYPITSTDGCASVIPAITPKAGTGKKHGRKTCINMPARKVS